MPTAPSTTTVNNLFTLITHDLGRGLAAAVVAAACIVVEGKAAAGPLDGAGTAPSEVAVANLRSTLCDRTTAPAICSCEDSESSTPNLAHLTRGSFTGANASELLVHIEYCDREGTALFGRNGSTEQSDTADDGHWRLLEVFADVHTDTCLFVDPEAGPDMLVCHRALDGGTWRLGLFHSLYFADGELERRQLTSYQSNARGCPVHVLRTEHPTGWRVWQVADDPRPPLLTIFFEHQNGRVPDRFDDACEAMRTGDPVFGERRRVAEYFELVDGRFEFAGATLRSEGQPDAEWSTNRRIDAPVCRRRDIRERVRDHREAVRQCYARTAGDGEATGRIEIRWTIEGDGHVGRAAVVSDTVDRPRLAECLRRTISDMTFTPPRAADRCTFIYPFDFSSDS